MPTKLDTTYPTDLTDRQWDCIKDLIPPAKSGGRPRSLEMRRVLDALLYLLVVGGRLPLATVAPEFSREFSRLAKRLFLLPPMAR